MIYNNVKKYLQKLQIPATIANPHIVSATGFTDEKESTVLVLLDNRGGYGYIRVEFLGDDGVSLENVINCFDPTIGLMNLLETHLSKILKSVQISPFRCSEQNQNCTVIPPTCTDETSSEDYTTVELGIKVDIIPVSPGPLKITPGSGTLTIEWQNIPNVPIFTFGIRVSFNSNVIKEGFVPGDFRNVTILGLIPRTYTVEVFGLSPSNVRGEVASETIVLPVTNTSTATFVITGPDGPIADAIVNIDGVDMGITDINGRSIIQNLIASPEGTPHEYLISAKGFNNTVGTIISFPGISIVEARTMTKLTPGRGAAIVRVICSNKPCEGAYVATEGNVKGLTDPSGTIILEGLIPLIGEIVMIFKPGYIPVSTVVDILENTTTRTPLTTLSSSEPGYGIIAIQTVDVSGTWVVGTQVTVGGIAFSLTGERGTPAVNYKMKLDNTYPFTIVKSGYDTITGNITLDGHMGLRFLSAIMFPTGTRTIPAEEAGTITLKPVDALGNPLDVVLITVDNIYKATLIYNGEFTFTNLSPGQHTFTAEKEGYQTFRSYTSVIPGSTIDKPTLVAFQMTKGSTAQMSKPKQLSTNALKIALTTDFGYNVLEI